MIAESYWFADIGDDAPDSAPWQPFLQSGGCCLPLAVWFQSEADCVAFIVDELVGARCCDTPDVRVVVFRKP